MAVLAVQAIRRMRGGAQSQLMLGSDGKLWVVKFQSNPQHVRVLANELIATRLAAAVGLTVPACDVVQVTEWLVANTVEMMFEAERGELRRYDAGLQFGSQMVGGLLPGLTVDYLAEEQLGQVRNLAEFAGMLVIDKWTGNCNGRQAVFSPVGARASVPGYVYRSGVLLQRGRVDLPGCAPAGNLCAQPGVRGSARMGEF